MGGLILQAGLCLSACLSVRLYACLPVCLSACLPVCLSFCLKFLLACLPYFACPDLFNTCWPDYLLPGPACLFSLSVCLAVCLPVCLPFCQPRLPYLFFLSVLPMRPSCISACLFMDDCATFCLFAAWFICLPACFLSACLPGICPACLVPALNSPPRLTQASVQCSSQGLPTALG